MRKVKGSEVRTAREAFRAWLIEQRGERSVHAAAVGAGIPSQSLLRSERGDALLSAKTLRKLCDAYGANFDEAHELLLAAGAEYKRWREWRNG